MAPRWNILDEMNPEMKITGTYPKDISKKSDPPAAWEIPRDFSIGSSSGEKIDLEIIER
jgi:hypothetical protein